MLDDLPEEAINNGSFAAKTPAKEKHFYRNYYKTYGLKETIKPKIKPAIRPIFIIICTLSKYPRASQFHVISAGINSKSILLYKKIT